MTNPNSYRNSKMFQQKTLVSSNTEKMILKKFNKEFMTAIQEVTYQDKIPNKIDCYQFVMLLVALGCIKQTDIENRNSSEYKKVEEMWLSLLKCSQHPLHGGEGKNDDRVFAGDCKLFLMASFGVKGNKRLDVDDLGRIKEQEAQFPENALLQGWLDKANDKEGEED